MFLNSVNRLIYVMVKCGVFFAVPTEITDIIYISLAFSVTAELDGSLCLRRSGSRC
jgi:hypothetical protein